MYGRHVVDQIWINDWLDPRHRRRLLRDPLYIRILVRLGHGRFRITDD